MTTLTEKSNIRIYAAAVILSCIVGVASSGAWSYGRTSLIADATAAEVEKLKIQNQNLASAQAALTLEIQKVGAASQTSIENLRAQNLQLMMDMKADLAVLKNQKGR